ncbi:MAG: hypothetical protein JW772_00675 [Candidatus Diapherotrites archaeon]|nr:hypothetical protein [Candidatus Diapherotrites archaeon]
MKHSISVLLILSLFFIVPLVFATTLSDVFESFEDIGKSDAQSPYDYDDDGTVTFNDTVAAASDLVFGVNPGTPTGDYAPDFDSDGDIDIADFAEFQFCFNKIGTENCAEADFDNDGFVGIKDFTILQKCYSGAGKTPSSDCLNLESNCSDSDAFNIETQGVCTDSQGSFRDYCFDDFWIKEYTCQKGECRGTLHLCPGSTLCIDGECR